MQATKEKNDTKLRRFNLQAMKEMNGKYVGNRPVKLMKSEHELRALEPGVKKEKPVKVAQKNNFSLNLEYM